MYLRDRFPGKTASEGADIWTFRSTLKVIKKGKAVNGNPYTTYACTNEKYGCDYLETKFVNLNSKQRTPGKKI